MTGKILIKCDLVVRTGLHIGGSSSFSAIGTVDSPVIRDPFTGLPIVPGSSLKGKLRTLLARRSCVNGETLPDFSADGEVLLRMFGGSEPVRFARLQFADAFLLNYDQLKGVGVTEVKSENTINRLTSKANPRQIERVVAGSFRDLAPVRVAAEIIDLFQRRAAPDRHHAPLGHADRHPAGKAGTGDHDRYWGETE